MAHIKFEIIETMGKISDSNNGWTKEINLVSWNGANPKYDIRSWDEEHEKMSRGITLTEDEMKNLCNAYLKNKGGRENV